MDEEPRIIRAVDGTGSHIGDASALTDLLGQSPAGERISSGTAARASDTRKSREAIAGRGAHAVIAPQTNAQQ